MRPSDSQSSAPRPSSFHDIAIDPFSPLQIAPLRHLATPDPSPSMNPQDPKSSITTPASHGTKERLPSEASEPGLHPENTCPISKSAATLLQSSNIGKNALSMSSYSPSSSSSSSSSLAASSSSTRPPRTLYPNATPPMSPAHPIPSPTTHPHHGISDPNQQSGFYQLPPPLQAFRPKDVALQSSNVPPQHSLQSGHSGHSLPLPPPRTLQSGGYSNKSPRSNPQQSPHLHYSHSSPSIGPLSPYPTPQHHPQSSPHQSPRYESHQIKQHVPSSISLPALSPSSLSVFQAMPPRPYPLPHTAGGSSSKSSPHASPLKSPRNNVSQRSVPDSPQRFMMLPPQTAPAMAAFTRNSESQSKTGGATSTKRRASSSTKPVDQETREMMRKVSHSAIERRRRERINDKILQLKHLVPACIDEDHLHKLSILQSTIEYIQYLKSVIPESVANAKFQKATNSNPNNKTTDMLEALSSTNTATSFVPVMTTGLGYPYSKRVKTSHTDVSRQGSSPHLSPLSIPPDSQQASTTHSPLDEDAKDGLLLLSQITGALSTNASPSLTSQAQMSRGNNVDTSRSQLALRRTTKDRSVKEDQEDEKEDEDQQYESEMTDDQEDDDYQYEDKMMDEEEEEEKEEGEEGEEGEEQGDMEIGKERKQAMKRTSSKMSVEQMLC